MKPGIRRFLIMIAAWPLGLAVAIVWLFIPKPGEHSCPSGESCALQPTSLLSTIMWLCVAFGPGVLATVRWWRGDEPPTK